MDWWKKILVVTLAAVCFGCQQPAQEGVQVQTSMEEEIRKVETAALAEREAKAAPEQAAVKPDVKPVTAAEEVPVNPNIERLNALLAEVAVYDYDKSRGSLSEVSEIIRTASAEDKKLIEKRLDEFLKSDATPAGKQFVCKGLSIVGTEESVATLGSMLSDEKTSDMARYALERIPTTAANDALVDALGKTSGKVAVGIINTLGERRCPRSVFALAGLIYDSNSMVASAAAAALGKIGGIQAANILSAAKRRTSGELRNIVLEACLSCANQFAAGGERVQATVIYQRLYDSNEPVQIQIAALRGIVTSAGGSSAEILVNALKSNEPAIQSAAVALVREVPADEILKGTVAELPNFPAVVKAQLITAVSDCGYSAGMPAIITAVNNKDAFVRVAALRALGKIGDSSSVQLLAEAAAKAGGEEQRAARESLYSLRGPEVDKVILSEIVGAEPKVKVELIEAVGERNITAATEVLLGAAKDVNQKVRIESIKTLKVVAGTEQLAALIELLKGARDPAERKGLEKTVASVACKTADESKRADEVLAAMESVTDITVRNSFLSVLGKIGNTNALIKVRSALKDEDLQVQDSAVRVLTEWHNPEPMGDLLEIAQNSANNIHKVLALRGFIRLAGLDNQRPAAETIKLYGQAMALAENVNEKKMVLSGLSNVKSYSAIEASAGFLGDEQLGEEAAGAIVRIAAKTKGEDNPEQTKDVLKKVIETARTEQLRKQAEEALSKIK